jgi:serine/threonine protein kinase
MSPSTRSTSVPAQIPVGAVIGGKYRIDALLAEGGMGVVYRGTHLVLEQPVAIKLVRPELTHRKDAIARFLREARTIAALRGEHVARVLDSGCIKNGPPYMVLEYLEGADLRTWLQSKGPLPIPRAVDLLLQACEGLAEAHAKGLVHRDVKPENLFLTRLPDGSEVVKVLDFGISKRMDDERTRSYTADGQSLGSPHYMGPEQMSAPADVDARADIWSLGVVLFELISGRLPFDGESVATVCARVICRTPSPLRALCPEAPAALEGAILRCLSKRPADRFASVGELAEALVVFGGAEGADSLLRIRRLSGAQPLPAFELSPISGTPEHPTLAAASSTNFGPMRRRGKLRSVGTALVAAVFAMAVPNLPSLHAGARYVATGVVTAARGFSAPIAPGPAQPADPLENASAPPEVAQDSRGCRKSERIAPPISPEQLPLESAATGVPATVAPQKVADTHPELRRLAQAPRR